MSKQVKIDRAENGWAMECSDGRKFVATEKDIDSLFCDLCGVRGVTKEMGPVVFYIDSCLEKDMNKVHPAIDTEMAMARDSFVRFNRPKDKDKILVLNFDKDSKNKHRMEILGEDAITVEHQTDLKRFSMNGLPAIILQNDAECKAIARLKLEIVDVTEDSIMEWYHNHPALDVTDVANNNQGK